LFNTQPSGIILSEFFTATINLINLPFTIFLTLIFLYWVGVVLGALDIELFDFDIDTDAEVDGSPSGSAFMGILQFLNIGEIPIMIVVSILVFLLWAISILANHYFNPSYSLIWGSALLIPNLLVSVLVAKIFTKPISALFSQLEKRQEIKTALYKMAIVTTSKITESFGQVEISTDGSPITVNARTENGLILNKGDRVVIYNQDKENGIFYVEQL
jgi:Inner membrane protein YqiJ, N-terminal